MTNTNQNTAIVSVLITVFNGQQVLRQAVQSVLDQTGIDFEIVVINDGSSDSTKQVLDSLEGQRLIVDHCPRIGRARALNLGIERSRGDYIAILDADDICNHDRLSVSIAYLECHPEVDAVGGAIWTIFDERLGILLSRDGPVDDLEIRSYLRQFRTPFIHSSMMFRRAALERVGGYSEDLVFGFDLDLIARVAENGRLYGLDSALAQKRHHNGQYFRNRRENAGRLFRRIATRRRVELTIHQALGGSAPTLAHAVKLEALILMKNSIWRILLRLVPSIALRLKRRRGWRIHQLTESVVQEKFKRHENVVSMAGNIESP